MFKKNNELESDPEYMSNAGPIYTSTTDTPENRVSVIGPTLRFKGELSANEDLVIEGEVEGKIAHQEKNLTVGRQGRVSANIRARNVEIHGEVTGDIIGDERVVLTRTAVVNGNIECGRIVLEDGALFAGNIKMQREAPAEEKPPLKIAESNTSDDDADFGHGAD